MVSLGLAALTNLVEAGEMEFGPSFKVVKKLVGFDAAEVGGGTGLALVEFLGAGMGDGDEENEEEEEEGGGGERGEEWVADKYIEKAIEVLVGLLEDCALRDAAYSSLSKYPPEDVGMSAPNLLGGVRSGEGRRHTLILAAIERDIVREEGVGSGLGMFLRRTLAFEQAECATLFPKGTVRDQTATSIVVRAETSGVGGGSLVEILGETVKLPKNFANERFLANSKVVLAQLKMRGAETVWRN